MDEKLIACFWQYVEKTDGCWLWTGRKNHQGYGQLRFRNPIGDRNNLVASRVSWFLANGRIPEGLLVCHSCDTPACVNPAHLFLGTDADNGRDRDAKGRTVPPPPPGTGESNRSAKLTETIVQEIRARLRSGASARSLAAEFGVTRQCVSHIAKGYTWRHVA